MLAASRARDGEAATHRLIDAVATVLAWALLVTSAAGVVAAPVIVWLMASGLARFDDAVADGPAGCSRYIACMSLVARRWHPQHLETLCGAAATPVLLNLAVIGRSVVGVPWFRAWDIEPIYALAAGVMAGGVLQLAVQVPALARIAASAHRVCRLQACARPGDTQASEACSSRWRRHFWRVGGADLTADQHQIASHVGVGAVSWLTYADRLMEFPTAAARVALGVSCCRSCRPRSTGRRGPLRRPARLGSALVLLLALPAQRR